MGLELHVAGDASVLRYRLVHDCACVDTAHSNVCSSCPNTQVLHLNWLFQQLQEFHNEVCIFPVQFVEFPVYLINLGLAHYDSGGLSINFKQKRFLTTEN